MQNLDKPKAADSLRIYTVKQVAEILAVSPHTLRAWERRYSAIVPERTESGRRHYSAREVARLRGLAELVRAGHRISEIAALSDEQLAGVRGHRNEKSDRPVSTQTPAVLLRHIDSLLEALREFRLNDISQQLEWARVALSCRDFVLQVVTPLMREVGREVAEGRLSVAQEHALSSLVRDHIGHILQVMQSHRRKESAKRLVVLATPDGDRHELGILLSAVLCAYYGIAAYQLGASLPAADLIYAVKSLGARLVIMGNTPCGELNREVSIAKYFRALETGLPRTTELWIGGWGVLPENPLPKHALQRVPSLVALDEMLLKEA